MITCQSCGHINKLGSNYCHGCGTKLELGPDVVMRSVMNSASNEKEIRFFNAGRSAITLAVFAMLCALTFRFALAPKPPRDLEPPPHPVDLFDTATELTPVTRKVEPLLEGRFLAWRRNQAPKVISALELPEKQLHAWRKELVDAVGADGAVQDANPLSATALTTLALQAWVPDAETLAAIVRAQKWLRTQDSSLSRAPSLTVGLVTAAKADWRPFVDDEYHAVSTKLFDGQAADLTTWLFPLLDRSKLPSEYAGLRLGISHPVWQPLLTEITGPTPNMPVFEDIVVTELDQGEQRLAWVSTAWRKASQVPLLTETLQNWSKTKPIGVSNKLSAAAGSHAATAVALLTIATPWRMPPQ